MKLTLRIENMDFLPDGGPLEFTTISRSFEVGRDGAMDWSLPDSNRHISSRHFEVSYRNGPDGGQYWLNDVSTNGTFVYGQSMRIAGPTQLGHNDRLQVGQYIIRVLIEGQASKPMATPAAFAPPPIATASAADPWSIPAPMPTPMPAPNRAATPLAGQFGDSFVDEVPQAATMPVAAPVVQQPLPVAPPPQPFAASPPVPPKPVPGPVATANADATALLNAIAKGAGLPAGSLSAVDPLKLGEEIGRCLRIATDELMALLGARAAAKQSVKSSSRTMIGGINNSPLKFKPNGAEAMQTMFAASSDSYLSSTASFQQGFDDIKRHQTAVYAAIQPALARLLGDLSPEAVEDRAGSGGLMSSKKARAWELFVERWDAKTHPYENGMLDVFLAYFADAYDVAVKKTGG
jgi:type VI secretion system protein ImpI